MAITSTLINIIVGCILIVIFIGVEWKRHNLNQLKNINYLGKFVLKVMLSYLASLGIYKGISLFIFAISNQFILGETLEDYRFYFAIIGLIVAFLALVGFISLISEKPEIEKTKKTIKKKINKN